MVLVTEIFLIMESPADLLLNLFVIGFIAALSEEVFFRGALQRVLIEWTGSVHKGVWIAAVIFSAIHLQFYGFFPRMVLGAMLGYMFVWSGSLWIPIFAHFINNAVGVLLNYYVQKGKIPEEIENIGSASGEVVVLIMSVVLTAGFTVSFYRMHKLHPPDDMPPEG